MLPAICFGSQQNLSFKSVDLKNVRLPSLDLLPLYRFRLKKNFIEPQIVKNAFLEFSDVLQKLSDHLEA